MKVLTGMILTAFAAVVIISAVSTTSQNLSGSTAQAPTPAAPATPQAEAQQTTDSAPAEPKETKWVSHYGDYYVTCYVSNGGRYYIAVNQNNLTDGQMNANPTDEMWAQVCGKG